MKINKENFVKNASFSLDIFNLKKKKMSQKKKNNRSNHDCQCQLYVDTLQTLFDRRSYLLYKKKCLPFFIVYNNMCIVQK